MKQENICMFNTQMSNDLICTQFILEKITPERTFFSATQTMLCLIMTGEGRFCFDNTSHAICKGTVFVLPRNHTGSVFVNKSLSYAYITFRGRRAEEYVERLGLDQTHCVFEGPSELVPFWEHCLSKSTAETLDLYTESVLLYTLAQLQPKEKELNDIIARVVALTNEQFSNTTLSLSTISTQLGYHAKYISSLFTKQMGTPYTRFLQDIRIRHAMFLIEQGLVSVKNVALLSGFADALYFSKVFKKAQGISPKEYMVQVAAK